MKKVLAIALILAATCTFSGCTWAIIKSGDGNELSGAMISNPVTELTAEELAEKAGLNEINIEGITRCSVIESEESVYQIDATIDGVEYNIRFAYGVGEDFAEDITGIYLSDDCDTYPLCGAPETAPQYTIYSDSHYAKVVGTYNGYRFGISRTPIEGPIEMADIIEDVRQLLSVENTIVVDIPEVETDASEENDPDSLGENDPNVP